MLYICDTGKNTECSKSWCCSGKCFCTTNPEYASEVVHPLDPLGCHSCQYGAYFNSTQSWLCNKTTKDKCRDKSAYEPMKESAKYGEMYKVKPGT